MRITVGKLRVIYPDPEGHYVGFRAGGIDETMEENNLPRLWNEGN